MVRTYKPKPGSRQYKKYDRELMNKAFEEFAAGHDSISTIARKYNISKSCLHRRIHRSEPKSVGGQTAFTLEREEHILKYIHTCAPWQYHLQIWDLRLLIKFYLDRRPIITKRKIDNNLPGQELVAKLLKRHQDTISQKVIQSIHDNGAITAEALLSYFHELRMIITNVNPENIVCYNDIFVEDKEANKKKETEDSQSPHIFSMLAASATGEMLQPYILYKEKQCYEQGPRRSIISKQSHQARKRLNVNIFEDWLKTIVLPFYEGKSGKKCLIGSFFSSRISIDILKICKEQDIHFIFLPDNSSNLTQPLDSLSQLIYSAWSIITHQKKTGCIDSSTVKEKFYEVINDLINDASERTLVSFKETGINPLNPSEVLKMLPDYNETTIEDIDEDFENRETDIVQVKKEVEWSDDYSYNGSDEEIKSIEVKFGKANARNSERVTSSKDDEDQMDFEECDVKLTLSDFQVDMCEDDTVYMPDNIFEDDDTGPRSARGRKLKPKNRGCAADANDRIYYVPALRRKNGAKKLSKSKSRSPVVVATKKRKVQDFGSVIDPLLSTRSANLHKCETYDDEAVGSSHCHNGTCDTHTRLLEAILSSATRQERLQERAARAAEAQAQALADIARLLSSQATNTTTGTECDNH